ncbi:MAG: hypothetical protein KDI19_03840 [Pseudomonadales bacterium]|nr:hypothetical protein [Pseudomonadales bacterium]
MNNKTSLRATAWATLSLILCSGAASGHELNTYIGADIQYSDNSRLLPPPGDVADTWAVPQVRIDYGLQFTNLEGNLRYSAKRTIYDRGTFPDRTDVLGEGTFKWTIADRRLFWNFYQNRNRLTINSRDVDTPDNQTNRSVISTGPVLMLNFGRDSHLQLGATYVDTSFDNGMLVSTKQGQANINYTQSIGARSSVGIFGQYSDTSSDAAILDYKSDRAGVNYTGQGQSWQLELQLGSNHVKRNVGTSFRGTFASAEFTRTTQNTVWRLSATQELTDSALGLSLDQSVENPLDNGDGNFGASDIIERRRYEASTVLNFGEGKSTLDVGAWLDQQDYQTLPEDRDVTGARAEFRYRTSPRVMLSVRANWTQNQFEMALPAAPSEDYDDASWRFSIRYTPNTRLSLNLWTGGTRRKFDAGTPNVESKPSGLIVEYRI